MYAVIFSQRADKDIVNIVKHVAAENPEGAKKLGSSLLDLT
jgi:plasmid stabilization system protein ParE